ncbi:hypothetical protein C8R46DRAFT_1193961 [Mycena filopes]|nr:hypothetical protein C8R46DRAFT_1193961 [Mycena filopes]
MLLISLAIAPSLPDLVIARDDNHYYLVHSRGFLGRSPNRLAFRMNPTTGGEPAKALPNGYPYIWLEAGRLATWPWLRDLLTTPGPIFRPTGRKREIPGVDGGTQEAIEIVIMVGESELCHCCYYCARPEEHWRGHGEDEYKKIGGEGNFSTYVCYDCPRDWFFTRARSRSRRDVSDW